MFGISSTDHTGFFVFLDKTGSWTTNINNIMLTDDINTIIRIYKIRKQRGDSYITIDVWNDKMSYADSYSLERFIETHVQETNDEHGILLPSA